MLAYASIWQHMLAYGGISWHCLHPTCIQPGMADKTVGPAKNIPAATRPRPATRVPQKHSKWSKTAKRIAPAAQFAAKP